MGYFASSIIFRRCRFSLSFIYFADADFFFFHFRWLFHFHYCRHLYFDENISLTLFIIHYFQISDDFRLAFHFSSSSFHFSSFFLDFIGWLAISITDFLMPSFSSIIFASFSSFYFSLIIALTFRFSLRLLLFSVGHWHFISFFGWCRIFLSCGAFFFWLIFLSSCLLRLFFAAYWWLLFLILRFSISITFSDACFLHFRFHYFFFFFHWYFIFRFLSADVLKIFSYFEGWDAHDLIMPAVADSCRLIFLRRYFDECSSSFRYFCEFHYTPSLISLFLFIYFLHLTYFGRITADYFPIFDYRL